MTILDRYLLRELVFLWLFTFAIIATVSLIGIAVKVLYQFSGSNLLDLLQVMPQLLLRVLEFLLPICTLISVVMVYGRCAADNEVTSIKACGVHPCRLFLPAMLFSLLLSLVAAYINLEVSPRANSLAKDILNSDPIKRMLEQKVEDGESSISFDDYMLQWDSYHVTDSGGLLLKNVHMFVLKGAGGDGKPHVLRAASATVRFDASASGVLIEFEKPEKIMGDFSGGNFDGVQVHMPLTSTVYRDRLKYYTGPQLVALLDRSREKMHPRHQYRQVLGTFHQRWAIALTPFLFVLIGGPLSLVFRTGDRLVALLLATVIALFVYFPSFKLASLLIDRDAIHPILASWSGGLFLAAVGLGLMLFAVRR